MNKSYYKWFIILISAFALSQAIGGSFGISGPGPENSHYGINLYSDPIENFYHAMFAIAGLIVGFRKSLRNQIIFGYVLAITALVVGVLGAFSPIPTGINVLGAHLQNPGDTIIHLFSGTTTLFMTLKARKWLKK